MVFVKFNCDCSHNNLNKMKRDVVEKVNNSTGFKTVFHEFLHIDVELNMWDLSDRLRYWL